MRIIVLTLLLLASGAAWSAGWIETGKSGLRTVYASLEGRGKQGSVVTMWTLIDYRAGHDDARRSFLSEKTRVDFDCSEAMLRTSFYSNYIEPMARSEPLYISLAPSEWETTLTDDMNEALWQLACADLNKSTDAPFEAGTISYTEPAATPQEPAPGI